MAHLNDVFLLCFQRRKLVTDGILKEFMSIRPLNYTLPPKAAEKGKKEKADKTQQA